MHPMPEVSRQTISKGGGYRLVSRLARDRDGSVAMIFGLSILVLCGMLALGIDYSRALGVKNKLQVAVDSAVLAADPTSSLTLAEATANVNASFGFNMTAQFGGVNLHVDPPVVIPHGYRVTATADVPTTFGRLLGVTTIPVRAIAEAVRGNNHVEIALVLDNTLSMADSGKMPALISAATSLIDQISSASTPGAVKYGLVPYAEYVNVGLHRRGKPWLAVPPDKTIPGGSYTTTDWAGCPTRTVYYNCDGIPNACSYQTCQVPGPVVTVSWGSWTSTWQGCVGSRTPAVDLNMQASFGAPLPGVLYDEANNCPTPLVRLTTDPTAIKTQIAAMVPNGDTYIATGIMWGWRVLAPDSPMADGSEPTADGAAYNATKKIMVVMTDGINTLVQGAAKQHDNWNSATSDAAMTNACSQVKATNIEVYTISFRAPPGPTTNRLRACATDPQHFFDAQDSAELTAAFNKIAGSVVKLALSK
jgi:Flp pilus assembly protein TadG